MSGVCTTCTTSDKWGSLGGGGVGRWFSYSNRHYLFVFFPSTQFQLIDPSAVKQDYHSCWYIVSSHSTAVAISMEVFILDVPGTYK